MNFLFWSFFHCVIYLLQDIQDLIWLWKDGLFHLSNENMDIMLNLTESIYSLIWYIGTPKFFVWDFFFSLCNLSLARYSGFDMRNG